MNKPLLQRLLALMPRSPRVKKIAAAVSGGCDSVAMLLLLHQWSRMRGVELCVFHVDHGLRPDSCEDAAWVKDLAGRLGLNFYSRQAASTAFSCDSRVGSEAWARKFRYAAFANMLEESGVEAVATGHTADDQTETILMRLLRGCSWKGLCGIGSRARLRVESCELQMWRPLLHVSRAMLVEFLASAEQGWREDFTNASDLYFRNRIRRKLLPLLEELQPGASRHFSELSDDARRLQAEISGRAARYIRRHCAGNELKVYITPECTLRREIIRQWLSSVDAIERADRNMIVAVDKLWNKKGSGKPVVYKDFAVSRISDSLNFVRRDDNKNTGSEVEKQKTTDFSSLLCTLVAGSVVEFGNWVFILSAAQNVPVTDKQIVPIPDEYVDNLQIRCRKPGDRFYPAGGCGGKKLARWLIDQKVPVDTRDQVPLLVSGEKVLLVCGLGQSRYLVDEDSLKNCRFWLRIKNTAAE